MASTKLDPKRVLDAIANGDLEGHEAEVVGAVRERLAAGQVRIGWRITFAGLDLTEENMTTGEGRLIERLAREHGEPLYDNVGNSIRPSIWNLAPAGSSWEIACFIAAGLVSRQGMDEKAAWEKVDAASLAEQLRSIEDYTLTDSPKDDGDPTPP